MCTVLNVMAWSMKIAVDWVLEKIALRKRAGKYNLAYEKYNTGLGCLEANTALIY